MSKIEADHEHQSLPEIVKSRLEVLKQLKKRRKHPFRSQLSRYASVIFILRDVEGVSFQVISNYLAKYHKRRISRQAIRDFYLKIANEAEAQLNAESDPDYWGSPGSFVEEGNNEAK